MERLTIPSPANDDLGTSTERNALPRYFLRKLAGDALGESFGLVDVTYVGRAATCQLRLAQNNISRLHARLLPINEGVLVEDLRSVNGTFINNKRIQRAFAKAGDEIGFDTVRFRLFEVDVEDVNGSGSVARRMPRWVWRSLAIVVLVGVVLRILL